MSHAAQHVKISAKNLAQPLSPDPCGEPAIEETVKARTMKMTLNPPDHSVTRPSLVCGRRVRETRERWLEDLA